MRITFVDKNLQNKIQTLIIIRVNEKIKLKYLSFQSRNY